MWSHQAGRYACGLSASTHYRSRGPPPLQAGTGAAAVQVVSVPPAQLARHAATNGCAVAALPAGVLSLRPGASYDDAVAAVVAAVEQQFYQQLVHAAGGGGGSGGRS